MKAAAIIAVRLASKRLPEKAIVDIAGLPMFMHTAKRVALARSIDEVYVATDSVHVKAIAESYDVKSIMTATHHANSTERIAEAAESVDADVIVNVQGDEPLVYPEHVDQVMAAMHHDAQVDVAIGVTQFAKKNSLSAIKAVFDQDYNILYASRSDIPCFYGEAIVPMWKLCFIVPFRRRMLMQYRQWEPSPLELAEDNHFLRLIEYGTKMRAVPIEGAHISVDTAKDLEEVRVLMGDDTIKERYL